MKTMIFYKRWKDNKPNCFAEFGIDPDNNRFLIGASTEIEYPDGTEERFHGIKRLDVRELYFRIWFMRYEFSLGTGEMEICRRDRRNFKALIGLAGYART